MCFESDKAFYRQLLTTPGGSHCQKSGGWVTWVSGETIPTTAPVRGAEISPCRILFILHTHLLPTSIQLHISWAFAYIRGRSKKNLDTSLTQVADNSWGRNSSTQMPQEKWGQRPGDSFFYFSGCRDIHSCSCPCFFLFCSLSILQSGASPTFPDLITAPEFSPRQPFLFWLVSESRGLLSNFWRGEEYRDRKQIHVCLKKLRGKGLGVN